MIWNLTITQNTTPAPPPRHVFVNICINMSIKLDLYVLSLFNFKTFFQYLFSQYPFLYNHRMKIIFAMSALSSPQYCFL